MTASQTPPAPSATTVAVRAAAWTGLLFLLGVRVGLLSGLLGERPSVFGEITYLIPLLLSSVGATMAAARSVDVERRFWACLAVATSLLLASETCFSHYLLYVDPSGPTTPASFQLFALGAAVAFFVMITTMSRFGAAPLVSRLRFYSGFLAGTVVVYVIVFAYAIVPLFSGVPGTGMATLAATALYPVVGISMLIATGGVLLGWKLTGWRSWERMVAGAIVVYAIGVMLMPVWVRDQAIGVVAPAGGIDEIGMALGPYLLFLAICYRLTSTQRIDSLQRRPTLDRAPRWLVTSYPLFLWTAVPVLGYSAIADAGSRVSQLWTIAAFMLAFLLVSRSLLSWMELTTYRVRAATDSLTTLGNEAALRQQLTEAVAEAGRLDGCVSLITLDIDDFSRINEVFGHEAGDEVLRSVAAIIRSQCREPCQAFRAGGDEFAVVARGLSPAAATTMAERILHLVERDIHAGGLVVTVSAGIDGFPRSVDTQSLVSHAFRALQYAKMTHRGYVTVYDETSEMLPTPDERLGVALKQSYLATVRALAAAVDARDATSREHSRNVAWLARRLGEGMGFSSERAAALETAGLVHDVGKIALPDELLAARGIVSESEKARFEEHVELGEHILRSTDLVFLLPWIRAHHERWDGTGYPDRLAGEDIPIEARILSVCDAYDAMTTGLLGAEAMSESDALREIELGAGTQFDPRLAEAFIALGVPAAALEDAG